MRVTGLDVYKPGCGAKRRQRVGFWLSGAGEGFRVEEEGGHGVCFGEVG